LGRLGSLAVLHCGEAHQTRDPDLSLPAGTGIDVSLAAIPFGALVVNRAFAVELPPAQRYW
jgi:hypothetical protein